MVAYVSKFIDREYHNRKIKITDYDPYTTCSRKTTFETCEHQEAEINGSVFTVMINILPEDALALADITQEIESVTILNTKSEIPGFGNHITNAYYKFYATDGDIGNLTFYYDYTDYEEFGFIDREVETEIQISNVIYKNHKYYAFTKKLREWLGVDGKVKRNAYLRKLTYAY